MKRKNKELQKLDIRLTKEQHRKLKEKSEENNVSIASLVRLAVDDYLKEERYGRC
jgi:hypothetical protein